MERRIAAKQMVLLAGGLLALPAWANAWTKATVGLEQPLLSPAQTDSLASLIDTLIPASDTPGALDLNVPDFVQKMVADCYEPAVHQQVKDGLTNVDALAQASFGQTLTRCTPVQRLDILQKIQADPEAGRKEFFTLIKNLTIQGYTTSEYVMTTFLNYNMVPGHYYGCVPAPVAAR
ncbi:gluconate 2-dehydrogenase subunit 3 family protein [Fibrella sp. ES10-3-2-2]